MKKTKEHHHRRDDEEPVQQRTPSGDLDGTGHLEIHRVRHRHGCPLFHCLPVTIAFPCGFRRVPPRTTVPRPRGRAHVGDGAARPACFAHASSDGDGLHRLHDGGCRPRYGPIHVVVHACQNRKRPQRREIGEGTGRHLLLPAPGRNLAVEASMRGALPLRPPPPTPRIRSASGPRRHSRTAHRFEIDHRIGRDAHAGGGIADLYAHAGAEHQCRHHALIGRVVCHCAPRQEALSEVPRNSPHQHDPVPGQWVGPVSPIPTLHSMKIEEQELHECAHGAAQVGHLGRRHADRRRRQLGDARFGVRLDDVAGGPRGREPVGARQLAPWRRARTRTGWRSRRPVSGYDTP